MNIDLSFYEKKTLKIYRKLCFNFTKHFFLWGSRKSGKSWFVIDFIFFCLICFPELRVLIVRRYNEKIKKTTYKNYRNAINRLGIRSLIKVDNDTKIELVNGSCIEYSGMEGNEESLKDSEYDCIVYEEAQQSKKSHYIALVNNLRSGQTGDKVSFDGSVIFKRKVIFAMNPPEDEDHYIVKMFDDAERDSEKYNDIVFLRTTIDDNEHATEDDYIKLEEIKDLDYNDYMRLRWGKIVPRTEGLIFRESYHFEFISLEDYISNTQFTNQEKEIIQNPRSYDDKLIEKVQEKAKKIKYLIKTYGGDFSNGTGRDNLCLLEIYIDLENSVLWVKVLIFDNTIQDTDEIDLEMKEKEVDQGQYQFWDNQLTVTIRDLKKKGWLALPIVKPRIKDSIMRLKGFKIKICAPETYTVRNSFVKQHQPYQQPAKKQIPKYSYQYNRIKEQYTNKPEEDAKNQGIDFWDALRYGVVGYLEMFRI